MLARLRIGSALCERYGMRVPDGEAGAWCASLLRRCALATGMVGRRLGSCSGGRRAIRLAVWN